VSVPLRLVRDFFSPIFSTLSSRRYNFTLRSANQTVARSHVIRIISGYNSLLSVDSNPRARMTQACRSQDTTNISSAFVKFSGSYRPRMLRLNAFGRMSVYVFL